MATNDVQSYTLSELFGGVVSLVIPDLQRDYCWGSAADESVEDSRASHFPLGIGQASSFVAGVVHLYNTQRNNVMGLLYGYRDATDASRIFLIEGQQPITTMYLLLGMLYRRTPTTELRNLLISDYALADDRQPTLEYQARSEAQYFLSDLVTRFFLDRDGRLSQLENANWYYASYATDPTVQSFIKAIRLIDDVLEQAAARWSDWNWDGFAQFVAHELQFVYCDLGDRRKAERMFVTLNTSSEPLTFAQNMRALTIAWEGHDKAVAERWNDMEDWFWTHDAAGYGLDDFLRFYIDGLDTLSEFEFDDLYGMFVDLKRVFEIVSACNWCFLPKCFEAMTMVVRATLAYVDQWHEVAKDHDIARIWEFFANITRYMRPSGTDADDAVAMMEHMPNADVLSLLQVRRASLRLLNGDERAKLEFINDNSAHREEAERLVWRMQAHPMVNGKGASVIDWCGGENPISSLRHYVNAIYAIWQGDINMDKSLDVVRRALLTIRHNDYPIVRRGDTVLSLCWNDYDWQRLLSTSPGLIRQLIDRCESLEHDKLTASLGRMADRFSDRSYPYCFLIKQGDLMHECRKRQLLRPCQAFVGFYDYGCGYVRWFVEQTELPECQPEWRAWRAYGARCLYTDHAEYDVAVDVYYNPEEKKKYRIEVFSRDDGKKTRIDVSQWLEDNDIRCQYDRKKRRYWLTVNSPHAVLRQLITS